MWQLAGQTLASRFLLGTAQYPSLLILKEAIIAAQTNIITVSLKRQSLNYQDGSSFWDFLQNLNCLLLPNTAGCRFAADAITTAEMARQLFQTNWIKLEVIGDDYTLHPDPFELVIAAKALIQKGFEVFPYCTDDWVLAQRLVDDCGCRILMPWASPIGSAKGAINLYALTLLRQRLPTTTLIIDAGIGRPSHAAQVMELGFDGVLLNTAVALAANPVQMASAFQHAIVAGHSAYQAGMIPERNCAFPSTALLDTPFWQQVNKL